MQKQMIDSVILELMASRICHDLISPVGAVNNGVEFLQEDMGADAADAIGLIAMSAQSAGARLQIFRLAYGLGGRDSSIKPEDAHKAFDAYIKVEDKVTQTWDPLSTFAAYDRPEGFTKMLVCALLLAHEAMPKGGTLSVGYDSGTTTVTGSGPDAAFRPQVHEALDLSITIDAIDPRLVHPYICGVMAAQYGFSLRLDTPAEGRISVAFSHKG